ncbi:hypothetical protein [Rhizobium ruizarguesonis]|uniref:hypothetical protein n=1 Tax=Rhizobium ruizarguesonis TaxID=2081791 RepID=UPI00102F6D30|nr:hypothetical protein [Rhizobium ruizarguesonis]TBC84258.1 hypothetical protein ELH28_16465 [Rhizobium ruizarguesonis]
MLVVLLAANSEFLGQFDESADMSVDDIGKEATDIAMAYRKRFPPTNPAYWIMPTLNVERMPRFEYGKHDSAVIDLYREYVISASMQPLEDEDAAA